ncbi:MAG TPA: hypothetical protein VHD81_11920 [Mycobacteriales bacterium]|nr:hypothetical protein [Mycobacteriales bacterium]
MRAEGGPAAAVARWGAVAAAALGCVVAAGIYAGAAPNGDPEAAYWWQPEPVSGLIPVPGVPSNGLYVAASPTGPQAESALRFSVADPTSFVRITLHVSNQERVGKPAVVAYPATRHWQTGGPQPWSARPSYRSSAKPVGGVFSRHGEVMTLTFPAHEAASGIVLLPNPNVSNSFTIAFAPPRSADVTVRATPTNAPSASSSASSSHRPTPHRSHHTSSPSSHPTHPHKTRKPSKSAHPTRPPTTASPTPTGTPTPALPAGTSGSSHGAQIAVIIAVPSAAVVLLLFWFFRRAARRRPLEPS